MWRFDIESALKWMIPEFSFCVLSTRTLTLYRSISHDVAVYCLVVVVLVGFPSSSVSKASAWNTGDPGLIPGAGRSSGKENDNPLQYSCLENFLVDYSPWGHKELYTTEGLTHTHTHTHTHTVVMRVVQSCPTLCEPMNYSPPGSSVPGILQARIL